MTAARESASAPGKGRHFKAIAGTSGLAHRGDRWPLAAFGSLRPSTVVGTLLGGVTSYLSVRLCTSGHRPITRSATGRRPRPGPLAGVSRPLLKLDNLGGRFRFFADPILRFYVRSPADAARGRLSPHANDPKRFSCRSATLTMRRALADGTIRCALRYLLARISFG